MAERELSIKEAAKSIGVSHDTIRRRIKAGELKAVKEDRGYGPQWIIKESDLVEAQEVMEVVTVKRELQVNELQDAFKQAIDQATHEQVEQIGELKDLVQDLRNEMKALREELEKEKKADIPKNKKRFFGLFGK